MASSRTASNAPSLHRRTLSAPTPTIEVEDVSHPLTSAEELDDEPIDAPPIRAKTIGPGPVPSAQQSQYQHHQKHLQGVAWRKKWDKDHNPFKDGRVLIVDLLSRDQSSDKKRQTQAHELGSLTELNNFYTNKDKKTPCLRIVHVQNSPWARDFLFRKYGIANPEDPVYRRQMGNAFSKWAMYEKPQRRAGRPVLNARAFRIDKSPMRNVWRTGFGADYLRYFTPGHIGADEEEGGDSRVSDFKLLELDKWMGAEGDESYPSHGFDVYVQRLSVYIQRNMENAGLVNEDWNYESNQFGPRDSEEIERAEQANNVEDNEEADMKTQNGAWKKHRDQFDNGTTLVVFESSHSNLARDTLIEARAEIEKKWRRLFMDLPRDDFENDSDLALECIDVALKYVFAAVLESWQKFLAKCEEHVDILEEKIYENPADESRAPELWANQNLWLKVEKLLYVQMEAVDSLRQYMRELAMEVREFAHDIPEQFKRVEVLIEEELTKPTASLNDLLYKSVQIRDSRHSLQLGTSMWRLSWITFIFLPLTFISGFFGMNVDLFQPDGGYPSIKWYFIVSVVMLILVICGVYLLRNSLNLRREDPLRRGTFEGIYYQFAQDHPNLWSRNGPRNWVRPKGAFSRVKWMLLCHWYSAKAVRAQPLVDINEMGLAARIKHRFAKKWLGEIHVHPDDELSAAERAEADGDFGAVMELISVATPVAAADGDPTIAARLGDTALRRILVSRKEGSRSSSGSPRRGAYRRSSPSGRSGARTPSRGRSGSPMSDGMVCEEDEDSRRNDELAEDDGNWERGRIAAEERRERERRREEPTTEGASALLAIPATNRQVLTRSDPRA
ncbi:hypothetical protein BT63DRAFT_96732 [Microthyrium microscopicum]|uniref:Cora-domain-containing protein n=1 Tax=Microthyrium microscopicum TaxID=703497 RepID=A0A6A6TXB2_9PEZI|nr:hypothetical protein BT63DRAFT_96732 [Microthyrium microscopicum]